MIQNLTESAGKKRPAVRDITEQEVAFYHENGWVFLKELVDPGLCKSALSVAKDSVLARQDQAQEENRSIGFGVSRVSEDFSKVMLNAVLGRNAQRLIARSRLGGAEVAVRFRLSSVLCKTSGGSAVRFHQDSCEQGADRVGELQLWLALDEATPEMGTMRFLSGVHREGPLGSVGEPRNWTDKDLVDLYPKLTELYQWSPPLHYRAGDATIHHGYMIHGSSPNMTNRPRFSYVCTMGPADTRYWESHLNGNTGSKRTVPDSEKFPIIYGG